MGLAQLPRIYFKGFTYWNPSTMNNNDAQPTYDPATASLNWPWLERHGLYSAENFDAYVTQPSIVATPNSTIDPNVDSSVPPAEWNFYGDNACGFVQPDEPVIEWPANFSKPSGSLAVTGYTAPGNPLVTANDAWIGQPCRINAGMHAAKLVDVDPISAWSTQIFADTLWLGSAESATGFSAATAGRAHSHWVFFNRNLKMSGDVIIAGVAGAVFQLGLPAGGIRIFDAHPAPGSLAAQVQRTLAQPGVQGLMVRFVEYLTVYFQGNAFSTIGSPATNWPVISKLYRDYAAALEQFRNGASASPPPMPVNRAYSKTVGWIAPWLEGELRSAPGGRTLHSPGKIQPVDKGLKPTPIGPAVIEFATDPARPDAIERISIDLGSSIPERDSSAAKVDFGALEIGLVPVDGSAYAPKVFARVAFEGGYDKAAYEAMSGVIDIEARNFARPVTTADLRNRLVIGFATPAGSQVGLLESVYTAETDQRAVYLEQPDAHWTRADRTQWTPIVVQVRYLGGKPPDGTRLGIAQYAPNPPGIGEGGWQLVSSTQGSANQNPYVGLDTGAPVRDGAYSLVSVPYTDDGLPYSNVAIAVSGRRSGPPVIAFVPLAPTASPLAWRPDETVGFTEVCQEFFANVRVLPFHNALALEFENWLKTGPSVDMVSQRVFDQVFRTFFLMYPVMRFIRDPLQFQAWRGRICSVTDPSIFETASYMPVMRSLSAGQRRILVLWNAYLDGTLPTSEKSSPGVRRG